MDWCRFTILLALYVSYAYGGYVITIPRKWVGDENTQGCIALSEPSLGQDTIKVSISEQSPPRGSDTPKTFGETKTYSVAPGKEVQCFEFPVPYITSKKVNLEITGNLSGSAVSFKKPVDIVLPQKTYIQTDKYLYKPGQTVQFRVMTLTGPFLNVLTDNYEQITIETPSSTKIAQWVNVDNSAGLIHLSFPLSEEPDEGEYTIKVNLSPGKTASQRFKVEDYVLPRYEVNINPPKYILATDKEISFEVCAQYTFGQPVKGKVTLSVDNGGWSAYKISLAEISAIAGCKKIPITTEDLKINAQRYNAYSISAKATVIEDGTEVELKADPVNVDITRTAISFKDVSTQKYRKPDLPYIGEVLTTFPDNSPAVNETMKVCVSKTCKNFTTNNNGILKFAVPPHLTGRISINAVNYPRIALNNTWRSVMYASEHHMSVKTYHSPSNSSLIVALGDEEIKCRSDGFFKLDIPVRYSASNQGETMVHIQVISRGQVQFVENALIDLSGTGDIQVRDELFIEKMNSSSKNNRGSFTFPVSLVSYTSPKAEILVWYARDDGEVVSDHRTIDITKCLPINAKLQWSVNLARPGEKATLSLSSKANALCSLGIVDKSVELLSAGKTELTKDKLLELAQQSSIHDYENSQVDDYEYCRKHFNESDPIPPIFEPRPVPVALQRQQRSFFPGRFYSDDVDAISMFNEAGVYALSDLTLESRPCNRHYDFYPVYSLAGPPGPPGVQFSPSAPSGPNFGPPGVNEILDRSSSSIDNNKKSQRTYFPETWLWELVKPHKNGSTTLPLNLPDTVTEWVGRAVCIHHKLGVGISNTARITTFRDFFVDLTLPATAKQGEIFPVKISVFNYLQEKLPVRVILENSPDFDILGDGEALGSGERLGCIEAQDKNVFDVRIKMKEAGTVNLTVDAMIDINDVSCNAVTEERRDIIVKPIEVDFEGFPKEETRNKYVCLQENSDVDESVTWELTPPPETVNGSARAWISAVSDLMGPTLENLGNLVRMPYGCGEQNMINFAPNIFILQYLEAVNQSNNDIGKKGVEFMEKGYQRELKYRRTDGSFSAFGQSDASGSTWLTAFVLKSFLQSRQFIKIDTNDLVISADWLKSKQLENGCFESVGTVHHKELKGGLSSGGNSALLSAYVLISLLEYESDSNAKPVREALFCLKADESMDPYALSIKAYALALAKSPDVQATIDKLMSLATKTPSSISWDSATEPGHKKPGKGIAVETASYALLALLTQDAEKYKYESVQIVKWINQQRNGQGGFVSTQDTVLALQGMALYETLLPAGPIDATVLYSANNGQTEGAFHVNEVNKILLQKAKIPVPTAVDVHFAGSGCVLVQAVMRYNIYLPESSQAFEINVTAETPYDLSCKTKRINVCASYILPDKNSNMAIIEVNLVSGYIPDKQDLKRIVGYGTAHFKRYEVDGSKINFYIDEFSKDALCASFNIIREVEVENAKPGTVKIYDYYEPESFISADYKLPPSDECVKVSPVPSFEGEIIVDYPEIDRGFEVIP